MASNRALKVADRIKEIVADALDEVGIGRANRSEVHRDGVLVNEVAPVFG